LGLQARVNHRPHQLSGGQQQRVAIARALGTRPHLIFADEPTGNLDSRTGREVLGLLTAAGRAYGQSIGLVTHDPIAPRYADSSVFLADGHIVNELGRSSAEQVSSYMLGMESVR
ncbi:ATP-binding cassette domain-containing protein, partial [Escherichia coli]|uniref:ATP-binding cassette domain-containing protein n=1 Tax=Escherichia coli TaxID=562 RepID=UPI0011CBEAEC